MENNFYKTIFNHHCLSHRRRQVINQALCSEQKKLILNREKIDSACHFDFLYHRISETKRQLQINSPQGGRSCQAPPIQNGAAKLRKRGKKIKYRCYRGFSIVGPSQVRQDTDEMTSDDLVGRPGAGQVSGHQLRSLSV